MINFKKCVLFVCGFSVLSNNLIFAENNNQAKEDLTLKQKISQKYKNIKNWVSLHKYKVILSCVVLLSAINFAHTKHENSKISVKKAKKTWKSNERQSCTICLDWVDSDCFDSSCGHKFHNACIMPWISERANPVCPNCKEVWYTN